MVVNILWVFLDTSIDKSSLQETGITCGTLDFCFLFNVVRILNTSSSGWNKHSDVCFQRRSELGCSSEVGCLPGTHEAPRSLPSNVKDDHSIALWCLLHWTHHIGHLCCLWSFACRFKERSMTPYWYVSVHSLLFSKSQPLDQLEWATSPTSHAPLWRIADSQQRLASEGGIGGQGQPSFLKAGQI